MRVSIQRQIIWCRWFVVFAVVLTFDMGAFTRNSFDIVIYAFYKSTLGTLR